MNSVRRPVAFKLRPKLDSHPQERPFEIGAGDAVQDAQDKFPGFGPSAEDNVQDGQSVDQQATSCEQFAPGY